jgi:hypothetical protein
MVDASLWPTRGTINTTAATRVATTHEAATVRRRFPDPTALSAASLLRPARIKVHPDAQGVGSSAMSSPRRAG